ncbi:HIT family protein [Rhabdothermincola salaria]|uniref:HIT family protein n=1 Tax=Rhabdothermincola salaria TaxID=2903142 RepID=UPI001E57A43E|nr:HIT family protein [Rhabdothermincola salaria]MCD9623107.1 HIT family protein [Rhabdothermincola salaria]
MTTIFTKILTGELPGRFVHRDETCAAFLTIAPITKGHTLVVPVAEVDHWTDLDDEVVAHLMVVAKKVGEAQKRAFGADRVALMIAGLEVPHTHLHVLPIRSERDMDFAKAQGDVPAEELDAVADALRAEVERGQ